MCWKGGETYTDFFLFTGKRYMLYIRWASDSNLSMHKLATIQFRSSEFNLMQQPHTNECREFGIYSVVVKLQNIQ